MPMPSETTHFRSAIASARGEQTHSTRSSGFDRARSSGWIAIVLTIVFFVGAEWHTIAVAGRAVGERNLSSAFLAVLFALMLLTLMSGSLLYQACRFGFLERARLHETDRFPGVRELVRRDDAPSVL